MEHREGKFLGYGGLNLYYQCWQPDGEPRAVLLVVPGLAEHSGRYINLVNHFVPQGYAIYSIDHRGHGRSEGERGYVERFEHYISDLVTFSGIVRSSHPNTGIFIIGHSIGGTIALIYTARHQNEFAGLIVSGAVVKPGNSITPAMILIARVLSLFLPKRGVSTLDASSISRDKAVVDAYINDPLVYRGKISARLGAELLGVLQRLPREVPKIKLPILILHGMADQLSDPSSSVILYQWVNSPDKTLRLYEGFYHEIFNEPGNEYVFADMEKWLAARTRARMEVT